MTTQPTAFRPQEHLMQIKSSQGSKDYLTVQWRLVWFRSVCPDGTIETEMVHLDLDRETEEEVFIWNSEKRRSEKVLKSGKGIAIFRAVVKDGKGGVATGTKSEKACSFPDFIEKAETGSIGRALAALGYGTQFVGFDFDEGHRIVDSPVESMAPQTQQNVAPTEQQLAALERISQALNGKVYTIPNTYEEAKALIATLSREYRETQRPS